MLFRAASRRGQLLSGRQTVMPLRRFVADIPEHTDPPVRPPRSHSSPAEGILVKVSSYYIARGIDILRVYNNNSVYKDSPQRFDAKSLTITLDAAKNQYVSVFTYGSVVLFNVPRAEHQEHIAKIMDSGIITSLGTSEQWQFTDSYKVFINENMTEGPSVVKSDHLNVKVLDSKNVSIISAVMAQTVSLDYYADAVDRMLETFQEMNLRVENMTGTGLNPVGTLDKTRLYKLVALNNTVITNVLSKLGIFEGSDAAWDSGDYHYTWEALRDDFELDYRFKDLSLKLDIVKDNCRFFLGMLQGEKSARLEWIIIFLIAAEIAIGLAALAMQKQELASSSEVTKAVDEAMMLSLNLRAGARDNATIVTTDRSSRDKQRVQGAGKK